MTLLYEQIITSMLIIDNADQLVFLCMLGLFNVIFTTGPINPVVKLVSEFYCALALY